MTGIHTWEFMEKTLQYVQATGKFTAFLFVYIFLKNAILFHNFIFFCSSNTLL
jgi:hypothetical protein